MANEIRYRRTRALAVDVDEETTKSFHECAKVLGIRRPISIRESAHIGTPLVVGWLTPMVLLPPRASRSLDREQLHHIFLHELAHVKRNDVAANWLLTAVQILHWFNPLVWYALHQMRQDQEIACDASVLRQLDPSEHARYGHTLIALMDAYPRAMEFSQGLRIVGNSNQMKERLRMIGRFGKVGKWQIVAGAMSLALLAMLGLSEHRTEAQERRESIDSVSVSGQPVQFTVVKSAGTSDEVVLDDRTIESQTSEDVVFTIAGDEADDVKNVQLIVVAVKPDGSED
jgi:bla regulator protein BlaR1